MSSTIRRANPKVILLYPKEDDPRVVAKVVQLLQRLMVTPLEGTDACIDEKSSPADSGQQKLTPSGHQKLTHPPGH